MQYIQLQGQVAAQLDLPLEGSYNLFIDTSDNTIKAKDSDGTITGGGNSLIEITKAQLDDHILSGSLTPGAFYKITGVASGSNDIQIQEGGTTIILQAATTSSLNPKGVGLFWNPNYYSPNTDTGEYNVWNQTYIFQLDRYITDVHFNMEETIMLDAPCNIVLKPNILDNSAIANLSDNSFASFFAGDNYPIAFESQNTGITGSILSVYEYPSNHTSGSKVIWGGRVWQNRSGSLGTDYSQWELNEEDWRLIPYNSTDYVLVADIIEYDYQANNISYRKDVNHNVEVTSNYWEADGDINYIRQFPFGHPRIYNVVLENAPTQNLVNIDNTNIINGLHMKNGSRFEANYWGFQNQFRDIFGDCDSDIESLALGKYAQFRRIRLGVNSTIGGGGTLYIVGNDGDTITDLTMGTNSQLHSMEMYQYTNLDAITMGENSSIYNINMYNESSINRLQMDMNSSLNSISMGNTADIYNIKLDNNSYLANLNLDVNAQIYNIDLGESSYMEYNSLENSCEIHTIEMGLYSGMYCNNLHNENGLSSTMNSISLGDNSNINGIQLYGGTYLNSIQTSRNSGFNSLTITGSNSYLSNFDIEQNGGFGGFTIDGSQGSAVHFNTFKIGQDSGFGGLNNVTQSKNNITVERGFNNFDANQLISGVTGSFGSLGWADRSSMTQLDNSKSFQILDTTGWDAATTNLHYYLPNGYYEGQTIKFFMTSDGLNLSSNIGNLGIWMDNIAPSYNVNSSYTNLPWYPFSTGYPNFEMRKDIPQCIWINGKWVIDNDAWD